MQHTMFISDFTFHIGSTPTFLYFDLYLNTAYAAHYVYFRLYYIHIGSTPTFLYFDLYLNTAYAAHYVYFIFNDLCS